MKDIFNAQQAEDERIVRDFYNLLPLIENVIRNPKLFEMLLALGSRNQELSKESLRLIDPRRRSPAVQRLLKARKEAEKNQ